MEHTRRVLAGIEPGDIARIAVRLEETNYERVGG